METLTVPVPTFVLTYNKRDITADLTPFKLSVSYTDNLDGDESDNLGALPRPALVITSIEPDATHASQALINGVSDVTCPAGTVLTVHAELRDAAGAVLPLTDSFRMPLRSRDGREKVLLAVMENGVVSINAPLRESGAWSVTEAMINESLPPDHQMGFDGFQVFVVEV